MVIVKHSRSFQNEIRLEWFCFVKHDYNRLRRSANILIGGFGSRIIKFDLYSARDVKTYKPEMMEMPAMPSTKFQKLIISYS